MSRSTFRVLFYLKRNSPKKNGMIPVMCRITVNRKVSQFSSKLDVEEKMWNVELGKLTGRSLEAQEGNCLNALRIGGVDSTDEKVLGKRLQEIAKNAVTGGIYQPVGELYGFPVKVVSERVFKEGLEFTDNRFVVEGNYKYTYNNGHLAMADPIAAARNFLNTLEIKPSMVEQYKEKNKALERDIPQLQEIVGKVWKKEDELKQLKSELAALDRKIQLELAPPTPDVKQQEEKPDGETHHLPNKTIDI